MTDWEALAEPFPDNLIKTRPGRGGLTFRYVDARVVAQRLDEVLTPAGWDFTWTTDETLGDNVVHGRLIVGGSVKEDAGYPNSEDDEEPVKSAVSDALKRCAVLFGVGRHLYEDNKAPTVVRRAAAAVPARQAAPQRPVAVPDHPEDEEENPFDSAPANARDTYITCAIHGVNWAGEPGDLWHKTEDPNLKGYCRHPENIRKARAR